MAVSPSGKAGARRGPCRGNERHERREEVPRRAPAALTDQPRLGFPPAIRRGGFFQPAEAPASAGSEIRRLRRPAFNGGAQSAAVGKSEERRVGKECFGTGRAWGCRVN